MTVCVLEKTALSKNPRLLLSSVTVVAQWVLLISPIYNTWSNLETSLPFDTVCFMLICYIFPSIYSVPPVLFLPFLILMFATSPQFPISVADNIMNSSTKLRYLTLV